MLIIKYFDSETLEEYLSLKELAKLHGKEIEISYSRLRGLVSEGVLTDYLKVDNTIIVPVERTITKLRSRKSYIKDHDLVALRREERYKQLHLYGG